MFPRIDYNMDPSQLTELSELGINQNPANKVRLERFLSHHPHHVNQRDMSSLFERMQSDLNDGEGDGDDEDDDYEGLTPTVERPAPIFPPPKQWLIQWFIPHETLTGFFKTFSIWFSNLFFVWIFSIHFRISLYCRSSSLQSPFWMMASESREQILASFMVNWAVLLGQNSSVHSSIASRNALLWKISTSLFRYSSSINGTFW